MRTLGPIGHLSADIRRFLAIEEEEALFGVVKIKRRLKNDEKEKRQPAGGRFMLVPDFAIPGPFADRPMSTNGHVSFHFSRDIVTKGPGGSSILHAASGARRLSSSAPADHDSYVARPEAVMALTAADFDSYAGRESAVELLGDGEVALLTNISFDPAVRRDYWHKVHKCERTAQADVLEFHRSRLSTSSWLQIASIDGLPAKVREMAVKMAAAKRAKSNTKKPDAELEMDRVEAGKLLSVVRDEIVAWDWKKSPIRIRRGRGGRTQFRLTAEFPLGIDAPARMRITAAFCRDLDAIGVMYTAAIHAPDHHNDERNFHLHIAYHDRPARQLEDGRWDFEIREKVEGQWNRFRYPYRQPKIGEPTRDPDGRNSREYGAAQIYLMREKFASLCNTELKKAGIGRLFDPRSYDAMGIDQPPTKPLDPRPAALEAVGIPTRRGIENSEIIWTAELQRNIKACNEVGKTRAAFRARVGDALRAVAEVGDRDLVHRMEALAVRFDKHAQFLTVHEQEIGELRVTLAMAHARPTKAGDTCSRILGAIEKGKASPTDMKNRALIEERQRAAEAFLDGIDTIYDQRKAMLEPLLDQTETAIAELAEITATLEQLLAEDVEASLRRILPVEASQPAVEDCPTVRSDRELIDELLDRIAKEDMPVLLPDDRNGNYRVSGISRDEYRLLNADQFSRWVQTRLEGISNIQRDRMKQAAGLLREHGQDGLDRLAATDSNSRRALKHLAAYKDHPTLTSLITAPMALPPPGQYSLVGDVSADEMVPAIAGENAPSNQPAQHQTADDLGPTTHILPSPEPTSPDAAGNITSPFSAARSTGREEGIAAYAHAIRTEANVRLIKRGSEYEVDPGSVPDWSTSANAFSEELAVRDAIWDRLEIEEEKSRSQTRVRIIYELERCAFRPVERIGDRWHIKGLDEDLVGFAHRWQDHEELSTAYRRFNDRWTAKEMSAARDPARQVSTSTQCREPAWKTAEQDLDLSVELQQRYLNSRSGLDR